MPGGGIAVRWLGIVLVLAGAAGGFILARRQSMIPLRLAQALLVDLGVLVSHVCTARRPLPEILAADLAGGLGGRWMWRPLLVLLDREEGRSFGDCWAQAAGGLPPPLDGMLSHLGPLLPVGGQALERAIEETREELTRFLREERARQAAEGRLAAAVCLSGACFLILVLI